jgi:hypothetical protein
VQFTLGKIPNDPRIDRAKGELSILGSFSYSIYIIKDPFHFGSREIGVNNQSRFPADHFGMTFFFQFVTVIGSAPILPNNGIIYRLPGFAIPYDRGFPLVGNTNARNGCSVYTGCSNSFSSYT